MMSCMDGPQPAAGAAMQSDLSGPLATLFPEGPERGALANLPLSILYTHRQLMAGPGFPAGWVSFCASRPPRSSSLIVWRPAVMSLRVGLSGRFAAALRIS